MKYILNKVQYNLCKQNCEFRIRKLESLIKNEDDKDSLEYFNILLQEQLELMNSLKHVTMEVV